jgi:hypothetical protein
MNRAPDVDQRDQQVRGKAVWGGEGGRPLLRLIFGLVLAALTASCGDVVTQGTGSSYLIVQQMEAASGAEPGTFGATLNSDVVTVVNNVPTIFDDLGRVRLTLGMKDAGGADSPTRPTTNNFITLTRYHVRYFRTDGRNKTPQDCINGNCTPDVPSAFDGSFTGTVGASDLSVGFQLVRHAAKEQAPLQALGINGTIISTICEITFYGADQTGHEVIATAQMTINFGNFGDPG